MQIVQCSSVVRAFNCCQRDFSRTFYYVNETRLNRGQLERRRRRAKSYYYYCTLLQNIYVYVGIYLSRSLCEYGYRDIKMIARRRELLSPRGRECGQGIHCLLARSRVKRRPHRWIGHTDARGRHPQYYGLSFVRRGGERTRFVSVRNTTPSLCARTRFGTFYRQSVSSGCRSALRGGSGSRYLFTGKR